MQASTTSRNEALHSSSSPSMASKTRSERRLPIETIEDAYNAHEALDRAFAGLGQPSVDGQPSRFAGVADWLLTRRGISADTARQYMVGATEWARGSSHEASRSLGSQPNSEQFVVFPLLSRLDQVVAAAKASEGVDGAASGPSAAIATGAGAGAGAGAETAEGSYSQSIAKMKMHRSKLRSV